MVDGDGVDGGWWMVDGGWWMVDGRGDYFTLPEKSHV
jgi:hypothetical protein